MTRRAEWCREFRVALTVPTRRGFLAGLLSALAAPAIVRASSLMPISVSRQSLLVNQNSLLTIDMITREAIKLFKSSNAFIQELNKEYEKDFAFCNGPQWEWPLTVERVPLAIGQTVLRVT